MSKANIILLRSQIDTFKFEDGTHNKYLPPNNSYKMLGLQLYPMLYFRDHLKHVATKFRQLPGVLTKKRLFPNWKQLVINQLLKSKYHATHLGIFTDIQLEIIEKILDKAARNVLGLIPSFPTETMHRPTKEIGLGYAPIKDKAIRNSEKNTSWISLTNPRIEGSLITHTQLE